jgi:hypothetical protein
MNMKDEAGFGLPIHWVQQALNSAYEDNCPLTPIKKIFKISEVDFRARGPQKRGETAL